MPAEVYDSEQKWSVVHGLLAVLALTFLKILLHHLSLPDIVHHVFQATQSTQNKWTQHLPFKGSISIKCSTGAPFSIQQQ